MISLLSTAAHGIQVAEQSATTAAADVARSPSANVPPDVVSDFVTLGQASSGIAIEAKVTRTAEEDDRVLLDVVA